MVNLRSLSLSVLAGAFMLSTALHAQSAARNSGNTARITAPIDENQLVTLTGNVNPAANLKNDRGPVSASLPMSGLMLVLSRSPEMQSAFDAYVESEYDSGSPNYHQWLTPDTIGERFGPSQADVAAVTGWLSSRGFAVSQVSKNRLTITFSGTAGQVESAFHTSIHNLSVDGVAHIANMSDPQIPAALSPVVVGVKQLHNFFPHPMHRAGSVVQFNQTAGKWQRIGSPVGVFAPRPQIGLGLPKAGAGAGLGTEPHPEFTVSNSSGLVEDVSPFDFATMYNVTPLWNNSITGANQTIAIVGTSDITLSDVSQFRSIFGLPAGVTPIIDAGVNGHDPGVCTGSQNVCSSDDLLENSLDVEWSGAVATGAQIVLVTSAYNSQTQPTNDPIMEDAQFIVDYHGSTSSTASIKDIANANIVSISYGNCELGVGTADNVAYYDLWQSAAAEGIAVFVATGDSGAPACDEGGDSFYGNPYSAQFGLAVSGLASTPYDVAVGGTDFSWCQPTYDSGGNPVGCAAAQASPYWNSTNNSSNGYESAKGYVPETPWNDTCMNPIWAKFIESLEPLVGFGNGPSNPEGACNYVQNEWEPIDEQQGGDFVLAGLVDTIGAGGGASNCVVNDFDTNQDNPTCTTGSSSTGAANGSIPLTNDGWQKPSWQAGVTGIPSDGVRDTPDVSFFAGDGALNSASLVCVAALQGQACTVTATATTALGVGGTSVATPPMAGVMALINQKWGNQGLPNKELYKLAGQQTYASCSAESVLNTSASCYFNDVDQGSIDMPCDNGASIGGAEFNGQTGQWTLSQPIPGDVSIDCTATNSGDQVGTLTSGSTPGYNAGVGYDLGTGLGSLNVANVVNAWTSDAGTKTATVTAQLSATTIAANVALTVTATVTGSSGTPTGQVTVTGEGANATGTLNGSGVATVTVPANSLAVGSDSLTITYSGDGTYTTAKTTDSVTVIAVTPTVAVTANSPANGANALTVSIGVSGPLNSATPTGSVTLTAGSYSSAATTLSSGGMATITIPANTLSAGNVTITATYGGDSTYTAATGTATVMVVTTALLTPAIAVAPTPASINTGQSLGVTVAVTGTGGVASGTVSLTAGSCSTAVGGPCAATALVGGTASFTVPVGSLGAGSDMVTANYSGDASYAAGSKSVIVTVTASTFSLSGANPAAVAQGGTAKSTITGGTSSAGYSATVTLTSCTLTTPPANAVNLPSCTVAGTIVYTNGTASATPTGTATVVTSSNTAMLETRPGGKGWLGAGGGAVLAFLVFLGVPARRRSWRAMLGLVVLLASLGGLSACGGGSVNSTGGGSSATTPGNYTFTVSGQGNDLANTVGSGTFTVTVN